MRQRYSFSSKKTKRRENIKKQRPKYPELAKKIVDTSDIILEVLDARFPEQTQNKEIEAQIQKQNKKIIYVLNKSDLLKEEQINEFRQKLKPLAIVSCKNRKGIKELRDLIKRTAKKLEKTEKRTLKKNQVVISEDSRIKVGVIGYPNTGKSSLLNILSGKYSAGVGSDAGFTKGIQKIKLSRDIVLIDSPGVIPSDQYSQIEAQKIAQNTIFGGRSYTQVREPEIIIHTLIREFPGVLEKHYKIDFEGNSEILIEELGKMKGFLKKGGIVDEDKTSRFILKEWQEGKILI